MSSAREMVDKYDQNNGPFMLWLYTFKLTWILTLLARLLSLYCSFMCVNPYVFLKLCLLFLSKSFDKFLLREKLCPSDKLVLTRAAKETNWRYLR